MVHEPVINYEDLINITERNLTGGHFENPYPTLLFGTDDYASATYFFNPSNKWHMTNVYNA